MIIKINKYNLEKKKKNIDFIFMTFDLKSHLKSQHELPATT
jgi:hypothetical protein